LKCINSSRKSLLFGDGQKLPKGPPNKRQRMNDLRTSITTPDPVHKTHSSITKRRTFSATTREGGHVGPVSGINRQNAVVGRRAPLKSRMRGVIERHSKHASSDTREPPSPLQDDELDRLLSDVIQPKPTSADLDARTRRTEIPNTPDLRSSQFPPESTTPRSSDHQGSIQSSLHTADDSLMSVAQSQSEKRIKYSALCCICMKQFVVGSNRKKLRW
jgi:hypothetical protein